MEAAGDGNMVMTAYRDVFCRLLTNPQIAENLAST